MFVPSIPHTPLTLPTHSVLPSQCKEGAATVAVAGENSNSSRFLEGMRVIFEKQKIENAGNVES